MKNLKNVIGLLALLLLTGLFQSATFPDTSMEVPTTEFASSTSELQASLLVVPLGGDKKKLVVTGVNDECTKYLWSTGETTREIVVERAGTYRVIVKDDCDYCAFCWQELIESIVW